LIGRLKPALLVLMGRAVAVPLVRPDTDVLVLGIETKGSKVESLYCTSLVHEETDSYAQDLEQILVWILRRNRFYWKADPLGIRIKEEVEK